MSTTIDPAPERRDPTIFRAAPHRTGLVTLPGDPDHIALIGAALMRWGLSRWR